MPSVTRRARSGRTARREEVQEQLLAAVERLLDEGATYTEISVERLSREAAISRATFYVYFQDKGELLRALTEEMTSGFLATAHAWLDLGPGLERADLRAALEQIVDAYRPHRLLMAAVVDTATYDATVNEQFDSMIDQFIAAVAAHIRRGQDEGFVDRAVDPEATAAWLTWMIERGLNRLIVRAKDPQVERYVDALTHLAWSTLYEVRAAS